MLIESQIVEKQEVILGEKNIRKNASISADKMGKLLHLLGNIYQDVYATVPLEYLSNAWDSHLEAGKQHEPIVCEVKKDINDKWYFASVDYGVGISPDRINNFNDYLNSTKDNNADSIGSWGLGCKSYLSYTNKLFVNTVFNGIRYVYLVCQDEFGIPGIELLDESSTTDDNGTKVWFYLNPSKGHWYNDTEQYKFAQGIEKRTCYFENIAYDFDASLNNLNTNKIYKAKNYWYSDARPYGELHIIIKNVPYKLDWSLLGISRIRVPIGIPVEGVYPMATREGFVLNDKTKEIIIEAIQKASTEIITQLNKQRQEVDDYKVWYDMMTNGPELTIGNSIFDIECFTEHSKIDLCEINYKPVIGLEPVYVKYALSNLFDVRGKITNNRKVTIKYRDRFMRHVQDNDTLYSLEGRTQAKKNRYLNTLHNLVYLCSKKEYKDSELESLLNIRINDVDFEDKKKQFNDFVDIVWSSLPSYDNIELPKVYLDSIKKKPSAHIKSNRPKDEVVYYKLRKAEKSGTNYCALDSYSTSDFDKPFRSLVVYGTKDDRAKLESIYKSIPNKDVTCIIVAPANIKYLTNHQYINVENFDKTKTFKRVVTAYKIKLLLEGYRHFVPEGNPKYEYKNTYFLQACELSTKFKDLMVELDKYRDTVLYDDTRWAEKLDRKWLDECIIMATENNLWDYEVYHKIDELEELLKKLDFIKVFKPDSQWADVAINYIKYVNKDLKLDLKHYQKKIV